ncbi:MAG: SurA N-terminal domain-containing protein [Endomicrobium sp.]|jgi:parvulin-like peptidyl-prolyl isomerase|nr:SurA N-terminal domain-containing protein [Endomicrobium sp.]
MKRFFVVVLMTIFMTLNIFATPKVIDQTLAIVNGEPIFASEFNKSFTPLIKVYKQTIPAKEQTDQKIKELKDIILDEKINETLLLQEAKKQKIKVSKMEINNSINSFKKLFKNEVEFNSWLREMNMTTADFENKLILVKLLEREVTPNLKMPTETELKAFYDKAIVKMKNKNTNLNTSNLSLEDSLIAAIANDIKINSSECVRIKHIFISCPKNVTSSKIKMAQEKIAIVKRELQKQTFVDVVKQYSEDPVSKTRNGDLGLIVKNDENYHPDISKTAFGIKVGDYTKDPIKTDTGYHFIKVEEKHASKSITFDDVKNNISQILQHYNLAKAVETYVNNLKLKASIKMSKTW